MDRPLNSRLGCIKNMPPLRHKLPDEPFDIMKSEVVDWIVAQPEIRQWIFDKVASTNKRGFVSAGNMRCLIAYNRATGTWQGSDYQEPCPHGYSDWDVCPDCCH